MPQLNIYHNLLIYEGDIRMSRRYEPIQGLIAFLVAKRRKARELKPPSWGQELEVQYADDTLRNLTEIYLEGHWDGSGPWEFNLPPSYYTDYTNGFIVWALQYYQYLKIEPDRQMGNHIHYRPAPISMPYQWYKAYANLYTLSILLAKLLTAHGEMFRETVGYWAEIRAPQLPIDQEYNKEVEDRIKFVLKRWGGRQYSHVTLNRNRKDLLTLEVRNNEAHPIKAWTFIYILTKVMKMFKKPLFIVEDYTFFENFGYNIYEEGVKWFDMTWNVIGLKPQYEWLNQSFDYKKFAMLLATRVLETSKMPDRLAYAVIKWVYEKDKELCTVKQLGRFFEFLKDFITPKTLLDYLKH